MCNFRNLLFVIVMQLVTEVPASGELCPKSWQRKDGHCFYVSDNYANFYVAKEKCEAMSSELAPVFSEADLSRLASVLIQQSQTCNFYDNCLEFWIGVFDSTAQDKWTSTNGTLIPDIQNFWDTSYPNENGRCVLLNLLSGKQDFRAALNNENCQRPLKYICVDIVSPDENLALGRPATQSSTFLDSYYRALEASRAVDGNYGNDYIVGPFSCSHTNESRGGPNWWRVQLDRPYRVQKVIVTNRKDCCAYRLDYFIVGVTNSMEDPVKRTYSLCGQYPSTVAPGAKVTLNCALSTKAGQYVIIQQPIDGPGYLTLCEVEVYARTAIN